jgi:hypothetical protein
MYHEKHHIIPKSLGGSNKKENIAILTAREHFICHILLTKMTSGKDKSKMIYAVQALGMKNRNTQNRYINSRFYENNKIQLSQIMSSRMIESNPMHDKLVRVKHKNSINERGPTKGTTGFVHSEKTKAVISAKNTGKILSPETKRKLSEYNKSLWAERREKGTNKRKPLSEETKKKISQTLKEKNSRL